MRLVVHRINFLVFIVHSNFISSLSCVYIDWLLYKHGATAKGYKRELLFLVAPFERTGMMFTEYSCENFVICCVI